ncbi:MAG: hypothetical protein WC829_01390 [Hyphomicrobium sp.]|jgi:hypothetical protein
MTAYELEKAVTDAQQALQAGTARDNGVILALLFTLLRHEADKAAGAALHNRKDYLISFS